MAELPHPLLSRLLKTKVSEAAVYLQRFPRTVVCHIFPLVALKKVHFAQGYPGDESAWRSCPLIKLHMPSEGHAPCQLQQKATLRRLVSLPSPVHLARISQLCGKLVGDQARPDWEALEGHMPPSCRAGRVSRSWLTPQADNIAFHALAQEGRPIPPTNQCLPGTQSLTPKSTFLEQWQATGGF